MNQIFCGGFQISAITADQQLYSWGGSLNIKMLKHILDRSGERLLRPLQERKVVSVACGDFHTLALDSEGQVWAWLGGGDQHNKGQCGIGGI